jgi:hypothetical protein
MDGWGTTEHRPRSKFPMVSGYGISKAVAWTGFAFFALIVLAVLRENTANIFWFIGGATIGALAASADANRLRALPALVTLLGGILTGHFTLSMAVILSWCFVSWRLNLYESGIKY